MTRMTSSTSGSESSGLTDGLLDRWVDGELDEVLQREWLARLDDEPAGWRRLALAFVESQMLRRACGEVVSVEPLRFPTRPGARTARAGRHAAWWMLVCGMLVGVLGTWVVTDFRRGPLPPTFDGGLASSSQSGDTSTPAEEQARFAALVRESMERLLAEEEQAATGREQTGPAMLDVSLGTDENGKPRAVSIPIAEDGQLPERWWKESLVNAADRERLAMSGRTVDELPGVWPVSLPDGRTAIVPMKSVRVRPAAMGDFQ